MKKHWYEVIETESFYESMVGEKVFETDKTIVLEFNMNEKLGGKQRVQFFKEQVIFNGEY